MQPPWSTLCSVFGLCSRLILNFLKAEREGQTRSSGNQRSYTPRIPEQIQQSTWNSGKPQAMQDEAKMKHLGGLSWFVNHCTEILTKVPSLMTTLSYLTSEQHQTQLSNPTSGKWYYLLVFPVVMYECESRTIKKAEH